MSGASEPDPGLRKIFLQELDTDVGPAGVAFERFQNDASDRESLQLLARFFHKIAGTALPSGYPVLGHLASICEYISREWQRDERLDLTALIPVFTRGLAAVSSVLLEKDLALAPGPASTPRSSRRKEADESAGKILVVDDDPTSVQIIQRCVEEAGFVGIPCIDPSRAMDAGRSELPDLIILDVDMPKVDGFELCQQIRRDPSLSYIPIIFVTGRADLEQRIRGLEVGGNDYLAKPFEPPELIARVRSHLKRLAELRNIAIRDGLTGCYNQRYFKERLEQEMKHSWRDNRPLVLALLDIDHFKAVNDTHGHLAGDAVLKQLGGILARTVRSTDLVARYGGEEFAIYFGNTDWQLAHRATQRLREAVINQEFEVPLKDSSGMHRLKITVSLGAAQLLQDDTLVTLFQRVDEALYEAKTAGRDRICFAPKPVSID